MAEYFVAVNTVQFLDNDGKIVTVEARDSSKKSTGLFAGSSLSEESLADLVGLNAVRPATAEEAAEAEGAQVSTTEEKPARKGGRPKKGAAAEGETANAASEGEGQTSEGEGQTSEGEGQTSEGEGQTSEGEGQTSEGETANAAGEDLIG